MLHVLPSLNQYANYNNQIECTNNSSGGGSSSGSSSSSGTNNANNIVLSNNVGSPGPPPPIYCRQRSHCNRINNNHYWHFDQTVATENDARYYFNSNQNCIRSSNNNNERKKNRSKFVDSGAPEEEDSAKVVRSLSECYFAGKGTALMLGSNERLRGLSPIAVSPDGRCIIGASTGGTGSNIVPIVMMNLSSPDPIQSNTVAAAAAAATTKMSPTATLLKSSSSYHNSDIQHHLQSMFYLLRPEETLKMAVKLESFRAGRTRYLVVVSRPVKRRIQSASAAPSPNHMDGRTNTMMPRSPVGFRHVHPATTTTTPTNVVLNAAAAELTTMTMGQSSSSSSCLPQLLNQQAPTNNNDNNCDKSVAAAVVTNYPTATATSDSTMATTTTTQLHSTGDSSCNNNNSGTTNNNDKNSQNMNNSSSSGNSCISGSNSNTNINNNLSACNISNKSVHNESEDFIEVEESCLLGIDCNERATVGLVLKVLADTSIRLDGDGGFSVSICGRTHIFKPVSVQAMWSALQTLHRVSSKARELNFFAGGQSHSWVSYYEDHIDSDRSCLNEWHTMDSIESRRPPSPDSVRLKPTKKEETECVIRTALKEIIMRVDLDEVTSKYIRGRLEKQLDMDLAEYKSFIDQEMLVILGQMDAPTEIFDHVYLGSEWNASNLEELKRNGVGHILNVTREIDNFFPGIFNYFNVRVYDDEQTDLLKHWDKTFKYISRARNEKSKVLVHCKMGISRSASVVIAYAMKAYNWDFERALCHVREKRSCINPNKSFLAQLETYQGMLDAMKNKEKLQRSKSETNLKSTKDARLLPGSEPTPLIQAMIGAAKREKKAARAGKIRKRPRSWSPEPRKAPSTRSLSKPHSMSLEHLVDAQRSVMCGSSNKTVLLPASNGQATYCVSQNQIMCLQENVVPSVKMIVNELESMTTTKDELKRVPSLRATADDEARDPVSRHSSFGSGDNKSPSSRNSSCSDYDNQQFGPHFPPSEARTLGRQQSEPAPDAGGGVEHKLMTSQSGVFSFGREELTWLPGTVKRTKAKIEERQVSVTKRACCEERTEEVKPAQMRRKSHNRCLSEEILSTNLQSNSYCRLSASAPENHFLAPARILKPISAVAESDEHKTEKKPGHQKKGQGMVKNLKMNFEAKVAQENRKKGRSLPSSPVHTDTNQNNQKEMSTSAHQAPSTNTKEENILEDINVRNLVDRYEETKPQQQQPPPPQTNTVHYRNSFPSSRRSESFGGQAQAQSHPHRPRPQSVLEITTTSTVRKVNVAAAVPPPRPPTGPTPPTNCHIKPVLVPMRASHHNNNHNNNNNNNNNNSSSCNNNARKFQQHGKTHPLARLDISKQKLNAAATYNTM